MNDDMKLLSMLLLYSQRRMVVSLGLLQAHSFGDAKVARAVVARLSRRGLVYVEGPTVRLTLLGFASAVAHASISSSVQASGKQSGSQGSRAA
jgi:hypothetical protein